MKYCFLCGIIFSFTLGYWYGQMSNVSEQQILKAVNFSIESMQDRISAYDEKIIREELGKVSKQ